jgi:hypothetical protein
MFDRPKASPAPAYAGTKPEEYASHEARPAHWFAGIDWVAPTWITGIHNVRAEEIRQKVGKRSTAVVGHNIYGDAAGHICIGMVDALQAIEIGGEIAWEGNITRPSDPQSPSYWRSEVNTGNGVFYLYWGRSDQPRDDILLEPLGNANADLEHPAYRGQCYIVIKQLFFGQNNQSIPNIRVKVRRKPKPQIGTFVDRAAPEGESIVAAMLELLTDPVAGAALPLEWFEAGDWEDLDLAVSDRAGDFSPHLTRDVPVSTALADLLKHFDGWIRMENGKLTPGAFPHNGNIPADLPTYTEDDFTEKPRIEIPASSRAINAVTVNYRDKDHLLRESSVTEVDGGHIDARGQVQNTTVSLEAVTSQEQAQAIAAEWVASLSDPAAEGTVSIRSPRARHPNGDPLRAGDNFWLSYTPYGLSQLCRIIAITTPFKGSVTIEFKGEPGVFPLPLATADPSGPQLGKDLPQQVVSARIFELPTPLAPNTSTAIAIGVLAMRPQSLVSGIAGLDGRAVIGFRTWYGATDTAYDPIGNQTTWAARATLTAAIADSDTSIAIEWDSDNLDIERVEAQSTEAQSDNTLLLIIGDEIMSVGDITLGTGTATIDVLRGRLSTAAAAHADEAECWLVYRDEITAIGHAQFTAQSSANFKLQPFTAGSALALDQAANIPYTFRDRGAELPQITIDEAPPSAAKTGVPYLFRATITDVNGDIERAEINIIDGDGTRTTVSTVFANTAQGAVLPLRTHIVFPTSGTWTVEVTAWDKTAGVDPQSTLATSPITVTIGSGFGEPDTTIGTPAGLAVAGGFGSLLATWNPVHNVNYYEVSITESDPDTSGIPPSATAQTTANSYLLAGLDGNTLRFFQVRAVRLVNGVAYPSSWSAPASGTSAIIIDGTFYSATPPPNPGQDGAIWFDISDGNRIYRWDASASEWVDVQKVIDADDFGTGVRPVEIVSSLPPSPHEEGRIVFLTTDQKLYRNTGSGWTAKVTSVDIDGQLTSAQIESILANQIDGQLTSAQIAALEAAKITGQLTDAQIAGVATAKLTGQITETQIADDAITTPKLAAGSVETAKLAAGAVTANEIAANAITSAKIQAGAVNAAKIATGAIETDKLAANAVNADKLAANAVTAGKIQAGAVNADKVAANSITASRLVLGTSINYAGDRNMRDESFWTGPVGSISYINGNDSWRSERLLQVSGDGSTTRTIHGPTFEFEPGSSFAFNGRARIVSGSGDIRLRLRTSATSDLTSAEFPSLPDVTSTSITVREGILTPNTAHRFARVEIIVFSGIDVALIGGVSVRLASGASLIVDGAVSADKIAANAVTAGKIEAGAITADKVGANEIIAQTANIKDGIITDAKIANLTAGKITSGTMETAELQMSGSGSILRSSNFATGSAGFRIRGNGDAEFNDLEIRSTLSQSNIILSGSESFIRSSNFATGSAGFRIRGNGDAEFNDVTVRGQLRGTKIIMDDEVWLYRSDALTKPGRVNVVQAETGAQAENNSAITFRGWNQSSANVNNRVLKGSVDYLIFVSFHYINVNDSFTPIVFQVTSNGSVISSVPNSGRQPPTNNSSGWADYTGFLMMRFNASMTETGTRTFGFKMDRSVTRTISSLNLTVEASNW